MPAIGRGRRSGRLRPENGGLSARPGQPLMNRHPRAKNFLSLPGLRDQLIKKTTNKKSRFGVPDLLFFRRMEREIDMAKGKVFEPPPNAVEQVAIIMALGNNGGTWATNYSDNQKTLWRLRAAVVISRVAALPEAHQEHE
jgi:hypothetical protein